MATPQQDELIAQFCSITNVSESEARQHLQGADWDLQTATGLYFAQGDEYEGASPGGQAYEENEDEGAPKRAAPSDKPEWPKAQSRGARAAGARVATFSDLRKGTEEPASDDEKHVDSYAGGEKSGLALQNPDDSDPLKRIFKKAAKPHDWDDDEEDEAPAGPSTRFSGSGRTLGSDDTPSVLVPEIPQRRQLEVVQRSLTFWRNGFSVEDGPLMRYDDPANREVLEAIESGRAPAHLMNVEYGQRAEVRVFKRLDEDYVPSKKRVPFSGRGTRLGSPTPGGPSSYAPPPAPVASTTTAPASAEPSSAIAVDPNTPSTAIQIRLGDGTRLRSRFNTSHTVGDLYAFVNAASLESRTREYVLQSSFPPRELKDHSKTVEEEGLLNSVVVQKWVK